MDEEETHHQNDNADQQVDPRVHDDGFEFGKVHEISPLLFKTRNCTGKCSSAVRKILGSRGSIILLQTLFFCDGGPLRRREASSDQRRCRGECGRSRCGGGRYREYSQ